MSRQRCTPEFKNKAVKLITECLGISQQSIYKWLKAVMPLHNNPDEHELLKAKKKCYFSQKNKGAKAPI